MNRKLPKRPRAHVIETCSIQHAQSILPPEWICTTTHTDYGLNLRVEIVASTQVTGLEFSIQLKATDQLKTSGSDNVHVCKVTTAYYFLRRPEPIIYLVYDAQADVAYWPWAQSHFRQLDQTKPGWHDDDEKSQAIVDWFGL